MVNMRHRQLSGFDVNYFFRASASEIYMPLYNLFISGYQMTMKTKGSCGSVV